MSWEPSDAWRDGYDQWKLASPPEYECEDTSEEDDGTEPCPACNTELADQYRGHCDVCNSTGRVCKEIDRPIAAEQSEACIIDEADEPRF